MGFYSDFRVNCIRLRLVAVWCLMAMAAGCSVLDKKDEGSYQRITMEASQDKEKNKKSLFEVIGNVSHSLQTSRENNAALAAHEGCRTNGVFDRYHVKHLYQTLQERFETVGVSLVHENGYVFIAIPMKENEPDSFSLGQLAAVVGGNKHVQVFISRPSPFADVESRDSMRRARNALAKSGVGKDHILLLPSELLQLPSSFTMATNELAVKLCYS